MNISNTVNSSKLNDLIIESHLLDEAAKASLVSISAWPAQAHEFVVRALEQEAISSRIDLDLRINASIALLHSLEAAERGDFGQIITWLHTSLTDPDREFGKMVTPLLPDVRASLQKNSAPNEAWAALVEFESKLFPRLPQAELEAIVASQMLPFLRSLDLLAAFRQAYLFSRPIYDNGFWGESFIPLLKKNREQLGQQVIIDEKQLLASVANWLTDFGYAVKQPIERVQSFDLVKYVNNSPNTRQLSSGDRKILLQLLEFYIWLHDPFVTHEDAVALGLEIDEKAVGSRAVSGKQEVGQIPNSPTSAKALADKQFPISNLPDVASAKSDEVLSRYTVASPPPSLPPQGGGTRVRARLDINRIVNEPELSAGEERLELASGGNSADEYKASLEKIRKEVLDNRRQQEKAAGRDMDGFKKTDQSDGSGDVML